MLHDYQKQRILVFLNPEANILGSGWHAHHARVAIGAGGWTGKGFMHGTQNQFLFLPDQHSDFPFAVFAEDWGFLGCALLVGLYTFLVLWAVRIAATAKDRFGAVLAIGVGSLIFWHAFFNLGMVTGILPVVGVTLPLFSAGGSSVLTIMIGIGLLMNVSMRRYYVSPAERPDCSRACERALQRRGERSLARDGDPFETQPRSHVAQLGGERLRGLLRIGARLEMHRLDEERARLARGLQVDARRQRVSVEEREHVVAVLAQVLRRVDLDAVVEVEEAMRARAVPHERIERREDGASRRGARHLRSGCEIRRLGDAVDSHG